MNRDEMKQVLDDKIKHLKSRYWLAVEANNAPKAEVYRAKLKELGVEVQ